MRYSTQWPTLTSKWQTRKSENIIKVVQRNPRTWNDKGIYRPSEKNLLGANTSSTCPRNMVNFGSLTSEIDSGVWGTPGNFNGFRVLAALLHGTLVAGVIQTLRR